MNAECMTKPAGASIVRGEGLPSPRSGSELVGKDQPFADGLSRLEHNAQLVRESGQDFFRPSGAQLGMDSRPEMDNELLG